MNNIIIYLFILVANVVSILLIYHSFDKNIEKTKRLLYTMIAMGIIYILVLVTYFFSSIGMPKEAVQKSKDMITFTFVPVNSIILIPFLLRSFNQRKNNDITTDQLNKRTIIVVVIGIALIIGEYFYFRNIEKGIMDIVNQKQIEQNAIENNVERNNFETENNESNSIEINNSESENDESNTVISNNEAVNDESDKTSNKLENAVSNVTVNSEYSNTAE